MINQLILKIITQKSLFILPISIRIKNLLRTESYYMITLLIQENYHLTENRISHFSQKNKFLLDKKKYHMNKTQHQSHKFLSASEVNWPSWLGL